MQIYPKRWGGGLEKEPDFKFQHTCKNQIHSQ